MYKKVHFFNKKCLGIATTKIVKIIAVLWTPIRLLILYTVGVGVRVANMHEPTNVVNNWNF